MQIEELKGGEEFGITVKKEEEGEEVEKLSAGGGAVVVVGGGIEVWDVKRVLTGAGARALFYPTLLYNVVRNKIQVGFRWWDWIDEFVLLGAVPFPSDVKELKELGVCGVITLNEPYETLVPLSLYQAHGIDHLILPTRDYLFAPSLTDICRAVDFIHDNASHGGTTYVHCKAGRGRSTTIVVCYLMKHKQTTPEAAYDYVKAIRPRVLLASSQWQAVQEYYHYKAKKTWSSGHTTSLILKTPRYLAAAGLLEFDDGSLVVVTEADLNGYDPSHESGARGSETWGSRSLVYRVRVAGQATVERLSCLWLRCHTHHQQISSEKLPRESSCTSKVDQLGGVRVNIQVY